MKKIFLSISLASLLSYGHTQEVSYLSHDRILIKEKDIATMLSRRVYYRNILSSTKVMMSTWGVVNGIAGVLETFNIYPNEPTIKLSEVETLLNSNAQPAPSLGERVVSSLWSGCISAVSYLGIYYLFSKAEEQYGPVPDIRWFVTVKSPFYVTLRQLYFLAQEVPLSLRPEELSGEMQQLFHRLIDQTEEVIAFMKHKKEQLPDARKMKAEHIIEHLTSRLEVLYDDIARALESDAYNAAFHLDAVLMVLEGDCARFAGAEKSIWINPSVVLGMMHTVV